MSKGLGDFFPGLGDKVATAQRGRWAATARTKRLLRYDDSPNKSQTPPATQRAQQSPSHNDVEEQDKALSSLFAKPEGDKEADDLFSKAAAKAAEVWPSTLQESGGETEGEEAQKGPTRQTEEGEREESAGRATQAVEAAGTTGDEEEVCKPEKGRKKGTKKGKKHAKKSTSGEKKSGKKKAKKNKKAQKRVREHQEGEEEQQVEQTEEHEIEEKAATSVQSVKKKGVRQKVTFEDRAAPTIPHMVQCGRCKQEVHPHKAQLTGKCKGVWRCNKCNSRGVQLARLPEWAGFANKLQDYSEDQKAAFWAATHDANKEQLKCLIEEQLIARNTEKKEAAKAGTYQPLSWYAAQGYDVDRIKALCKDTQEHDIFGITYRVTFNSLLEVSVGEKVEEKAYKKLQGTGASSSGDNTSGGAPPPPEDPKATERQLLKEKAVATKVLAKLASVIFPLRTTLAHKAFTMIWATLHAGHLYITR